MVIVIIYVIIDTIKMLLRWNGHLQRR